MQKFLDRLAVVASGARPLIGAHRGASAKFPENTIAAFAAALTMGADFIELDVQLTRDAVPIILHDDTIDRTTTGHGLASNLTYNQIREFGDIPTLRRILSLAANRIFLNIELKAGPNIGLLATKVLALIKEYHMESQVIISSFDHGILPQIKQDYPTIATGVLYEHQLSDAVAYAHRLSANALHPNFNLVQLPLVQQAHDGELYVLTWTVDHPVRLRQLLSMPIDGIISNQPDLALAVAAESHILSAE